VIQKLDELGIRYAIGKDTNYKSDKRTVIMEYLDDLDITEFRELPTYKRMCVCILKNDHTCKFMGYSLTKYESELRKNAETKYANVGEMA
jgi:predicted phosphoadenosine phosphosulfate sulfurtransferase